MRRAPGFWAADTPSVWPALLAPAATLYAAVTARRVARSGWRAPVPVICCGNAGAGGAGKTTLAMDLLRRLQTLGGRPHALLRGYGGRVRGPLLVDPARHDAATVGDEALLLAAVAPTWVAADRAAGAQASVQAGAHAIVMDDGLQHPTLHRDLALLTIDGGFGFGNGLVIPAGPLREPIVAAAARCHAAVLIGEDRHGALEALPPGLPVLRVTLVSGPETAALAGRRVFAFCGIARPEKFWATLEAAGAVVRGRRAFPDHHRFGAAELRAVLDAAAREEAVVVTTAKDATRLPAALREVVHVATIELRWDDDDAPMRLLRPLIAAGQAESTHR